MKLIMKGARLYKNMRKVFIILFCICMISFINNYAFSKTTQYVNKEIQCICIEDEFMDDAVIVVLNHNVSLEFIEYNKNDFPEIDCADVEDLTQYTTNIVNLQQEAEKTGDWSKLQERIDNHMLVNIDSFHRILCLRLANPGKENVLSAIVELQKREDILSAEPDYIEHATFSPNDAFYVSGYQWGLNGTYGINAQKAWNYAVGNASILVGVIDSGIDGNHPDLVNNIYDGLHRDYVDHPIQNYYIDVNAEDLEDPLGHGTHVAGIIGARGNNTIGISGVMQSVSLVSLRILDANNNGTNSDAERAIDYATDVCIPILNYSIYSQYDYNGLRSAIQNYPGLFVCAAGNDNQNNDENGCYPSNYDFTNLITVGSITNTNGEKRFDSNYGQATVDIFAPGDNIASTYPYELYFFSNQDYTIDVGYYIKSGTSMAAPFVAGVAALMLSINPDLTPQQLKSTIMNNAVKYSTLTDLCVCGGRLDAYRAVAAVALSTTSSVDGITIDGFSSGYIPPSNMELEIPNYMACLNSSYGNYERYVVGISSNSFKNKTNIKNVVIPNTVTSIGASAFDGCTNLESVTLSSSLQTIGSFAFKGCTSLEEIEIPSSVNSIGANAFKLCASLESVTIKKEQSPITTIGSNALMNCFNISEIKVPDNRIADYINNVNWSGYSSLIVPENNNYTTYYLGSSPINASTYLNAGYNKLYKLTVTSSNTYYINSTSNNNITTKLYDSNYQLLNTSNGLISRYLNGGATYYLSVEYNNPSWIGTIYTNITTDSSHQHSYTYVWNSYTKHTKQCLCGDSSLKSHVVDANAFNNGQQYATCMVCGGLASVGINPRAINNYPYTLNGSFILPNGVIVLVSEDYEAYMNDTLVFINPNDNIDRGNSFIPCLIRKEDNYWINVS